jgi:hypothetical protein
MVQIIINASVHKSIIGVPPSSTDILSVLDASRNQVMWRAAVNAVEYLLSSPHERKASNFKNSIHLEVRLMF